MKKTFEFFVNESSGQPFCDFINSLTEKKKKFHVTPWSSEDGSEAGYIVWYYV